MLQRFTFYQNHVSGRIQRRLDYFLISNFLQGNDEQQGNDD